jgi:hypothetical protein
MKTYRLGNLTLVLDKSQVFPNDPGQGTPAMVYHKNGSCATFWCACGEGQLMSDKGDYKLSDRQLEWLDNLDREITDYLYKD